MKRLLLLGIVLLSLCSFGSGPAHVHASPVPKKYATNNSPYGVTVAVFNPNVTLDPQLFIDLKKLGVGKVRFQESWKIIEGSPGVYNWTALDDTVSRASAAGLDVIFPLREAPAQYNTVRCNPSSSHPLYQMDPNALAAFANLVATRYNGNNGHSFISAIEIGNEDYDVMYDPTQPLTVQGQVCRDPQWYIPALKAVTPVIRAASPNTQVGMFGMWWEYSPHHIQFMQGLYNAGCGPLFDYADFHFYSGSVDPLVDTNQNRLSLPGQFDEIHDVMEANGDSSKQIHVSEIGWSVPDQVTEAMRAKYYSEAMDSMRTSGLVNQFELYTINYSGSGFSLVSGVPPHLTYSPAFHTIQRYIKKYPHW